MPLGQDVVEKVKAYIKQAEDGGHVAAISNLFTYLKSRNLMYTQRVIPSLVHIHPDNRDGLGCYPTEVHGLLTDIGSSGWSWSEVKAIATEVPHGDTKVQEFNQKLIQSSHGMLPEVQPGTVKFASLSATHTNLVLRLFAAECKHSDERFCTSGHLSMEKLQRHDCNVHDAVTHGLSWDILSSEILGSFPELASLIQLTANTSGQLQRKETELQLAKRAYACWEKKSKQNPQVKFEDVKADLLRSKPACQESLANLFRFVMQYGGGQGCSFLNETIQVCSACPPKTLGNEFWSAILTQPRFLASLQSYIFL